jgi:hypothetical protein
MRRLLCNYPSQTKQAMLAIASEEEKKGKN